MKKISILFALFTLLSYSQTYHANLEYYLPSDVTYNPNIPTPKEIIGFQVGDWHITHDKLVQYMYALAEASPRIHIENRGTTYEGRPLLLLTITSPKNQASINTIQKQHLKITEETLDESTLQKLPAVLYQGFSIHGNEPSGSNAALLVAYYLAAAQGEKIDSLLNEVVILFDPCYNPDGLQRFAYWANANKSKNINPDPNDREYHEIWPGGRTNHYWFDMNRDWLPVQLPESQARIKTFHNWYPNVLTDHHEMGTNATFFFQPGIPSRTHPLTPQRNQDLTKLIATFHAKAFNKIGSLYYTEESYDDFYYGKGSTFPDINGGIGILFEQASSRGHAQESDNGIITFPFTIKNQFTAALSTLEATQTLRLDLLKYKQNFYKNARNETSKESYIIADTDTDKLYQLAKILKQHDIHLYQPKENITIENKQYSASESYVIPKSQKQSRLLKAMFEKRTSFTDSLFYDISAWSLQLAFNVEFKETTSSITLNKEFNNEVIKVIPPGYSDYAYLLDWGTYFAPKALAKLLEKGIRVKVGFKPFTLANKNYDYGTILIPVQNQSINATQLHELLKNIATESNAKITAVNTGLTQGIDLGSNLFKTIKKPAVGLIVGDGITPYDAGEIWHLFDQRYDMTLTKLDVKDINYIDLSKYTTLILPNNRQSMDEKLANKLEPWIKQGGVLIAYKNAGKWLAKNKLLDAHFITKKDTASAIRYEQRGAYFGSQVIGGAIFNTHIDRSHPIAFGYGKEHLPVFRNSTLFLKPEKDSFNNPILYTDNPLLSGYISHKNLDLLKNTAMFKASNLGRGTILYFTDNTNFRAFWFGTNKLLMNAVFFGDMM